MAVTGTRRDVLHLGYGTAAALGISALAPAGGLGPVQAVAQGASTSDASAEDFFYREDWFGEPWRKPETAVLIHGNAESSIVWYAWLPRMAQEFRVLRPDLPGLGRSRIPAGFEWSLPSLAAFVAHILDKAGADAAHVIGAKAGGAIAMQFAADYPALTRTLSVVHVPSAVTNVRVSASATSFAPQSARLGSAASKEMVDYWANMFATAPELPAKGLLAAVSKSDPARDGLLQRIKAPTLLILAEPATPYLPDTMMRERAAQVADIEVVHVAGHHHLHLESPDAVFEVIGRFFAARSERHGEPRLPSP